MVTFVNNYKIGRTEQIGQIVENEEFGEIEKIGGVDEFDRKCINSKKYSRIWSF